MRAAPFIWTVACPERCPLMAASPPEHTLGPDNAGLNGVAGLHDREQRDHAAQRKIDVINLGALLVKHGIRLELHWDEPRLDAFEFVSRKLPQNAVLYDVLGLHMPASVAPSAGQRPRHGNRTRRIAPAAETYTRQLCPFFVLYKRGQRRLRHLRPDRE